MLRRFSGVLRLTVGVLLSALGACRKSERLADAQLARDPVVRSAPRRIVVLGSSTSAGVGPREPEDAYVPRYAAILSRQFPDFTVTNLAVGGQTTYHIQPTGFVPPPNRPAPAAGANISAALALDPDAILVHLPSNDTAANIPAREQIENFVRVAKLADDAKVPVWLGSTQPRNLTATQIVTQRRVREAILNRFGRRALDFFTPLATPLGRLKAEYDAGDGTHLNAAGHTILLKIVLGARIPQSVLQASG
jgi:lysophospholipase L1-like esterase